VSDDKYDRDLHKRDANYFPLTPLTGLKRTAWVYPDKVGVIDDDASFTYAQLYARCRRMASALQRLGIRRMDTVAALCFNGHEMLECHYSVPMAGAVLNALNIRLDAKSIRFILEHGEARALIYDTEFEALVREALQGLEQPPTLIAVNRTQAAELDAHDYEALLASGDAHFDWQPPQDEWDAISLCYTSGTTGNPKGVVYHHRGAYLSSLGNAMGFNMTPDTVYLWTLPMFHCNGWCYTWAITTVGGTHVCLRKVRSDDILQKIRAHGVTHACGAPVVLNALLDDFSRQGIRLDPPVHFALGGAAPPNAVIAKSGSVGFEITHLYGLTESYGPATVCVWQQDWAGLDNNALAAQMARQGVGLYAMDDVQVLDQRSGELVPADAQTLGEVVLRGNTLMKGYLKNPDATGQALRDGWFHTGDLGVMYPDGYVEVKDRAKDIIISGGENISSKEVEDVLYSHPAVLEAAVVARPDERWGEVPCAFVTLREGADPLSEEELIAFCRVEMAAFKIPKHVVFGPLPKTSTGKIRKNELREQARSGAAEPG